MEITKELIESLEPWHFNFKFETSNGPLYTGPVNHHTGEIHPKMSQLIKADAFPRNVYQNVLDLGANAGMHSLYFAKNKASHVDAVEGHKRFYDQLEFVVKAYGMAQRIKPIFLDLNGEVNFPSQYYDLILFLGTMHHLKPEIYPEFFKMLFKATIPGGEIVVQTKTTLENDVIKNLQNAGYVSIVPLTTNWNDRAAWKARRDVMKLF